MKWYTMRKHITNWIGCMFLCRIWWIPWLWSTVMKFRSKKPRYLLRFSQRNLHWTLLHLLEVLTDFWKFQDAITKVKYYFETFWFKVWYGTISWTASYAYHFQSSSGDSDVQKYNAFNSVKNFSFSFICCDLAKRNMETSNEWSRRRYWVEV